MSRLGEYPSAGFGNVEGGLYPIKAGAIDASAILRHRQRSVLPWSAVRVLHGSLPVALDATGWVGIPVAAVSGDRARPATPTVIPTDANTMAATRRGPVSVARRLGIRSEISETR